MLAARLVAGDAVAVEDPGWPNLLDLLASAGLRVLPVTVDQAGPVPTSLAAALRGGARAVVVTSRAQNPTGAYVTAERATALRRVLAAHADVLVVEDDHAAELAGVPLASLAGATGAWAFVRSLSKPYGPDLRLAVLAGDEATVARVEGQLRIGSGWVSTLLQRAAVALWSDPAVAEVVADAAHAYDARRTALRDGLPPPGSRPSGRPASTCGCPSPTRPVSSPSSSPAAGRWRREDDFARGPARRSRHRQTARARAGRRARRRPPCGGPWPSRPRHDRDSGRSDGAHQPRARHSARCGRSVPIVVASPWPGCTTVSSAKRLKTLASRSSISDSKSSGLQVRPGPPGKRLSPVKRCVGPSGPR